MWGESEGIKDVSDQFFTFLRCPFKFYEFLKLSSTEVKRKSSLATIRMQMWEPNSDKLVFDILWFGNRFACEPEYFGIWKKSANIFLSV